MSNFEDAVKSLVPHFCPHCKADGRGCERTASGWFCSCCSKSFTLNEQGVLDVVEK